ncbi:BofC C-terminal domain-containing protein [Tepidibacillus sp. HK-1]|uniref:BofC C-terminal domain-containing protein n=1 Tax=Tepidibacillus sp. HK-1 TaxID=1883407 RepID=UPI000852B952|nr:BofC C-terminal domain-containing protein [Tepidibacillus sp. HK-1]GBF10017.1 hypothetical protein HK1_00029 [Tepidibacillus sp. HK-1]
MFFGNHKTKYSYLITLLLIALAIGFYPLLTEKGEEPNSDATEPLAQEVASPINTKLVMVTHYVVGEDLVETKNESYTSLTELEQKYAGWKIIAKTDQEIKMERYLEDLSPKIKNGAYFGLSPDGYFTLYQGTPNENEVIETFFRIDIDSLESALPSEPIEQLHQGIPIRDLAEYNSILSTYSEFSMDDNESR